jgi:hypothetical protein
MSSPCCNQQGWYSNTLLFSRGACGPFQNTPRDAWQWWKHPSINMPSFWLSWTGLTASNNFVLHPANDFQVHVYWVYSCSLWQCITMQHNQLLNNLLYGFPHTASQINNTPSQFVEDDHQKACHPRRAIREPQAKHRQRVKCYLV